MLSGKLHGPRLIAACRGKHIVIDRRRVSHNQVEVARKWASSIKFVPIRS